MTGNSEVIQTRELFDKFSGRKIRTARQRELSVTKDKYLVRFNCLESIFGIAGSLKKCAVPGNEH